MLLHDSACSRGQYAESSEESTDLHVTVDRNGELAVHQSLPGSQPDSQAVTQHLPTSI